MSETNSKSDIQNINSGNFSMAKILLVFYAYIAIGYTDVLMAKQLQEFIRNNRLVQHVFGFIIMVTLITMLEDHIDTRTAIIYATVSYIWFILSTKLDVHWNIIIIILLFLGYMYDNNIKVRNNDILNDPNLSDEKKQELIDENNNTKSCIVWIVSIITIIGTLLYSYKKHCQYGGNYDPILYLLY